MKTVVFVNPPLTLEARYGALAQAGATEPPFGLCYMAAVTRRAGYDTHIVDAEAEHLSPAGTAARVLEHRPDYVGLTATTPAIMSAAEVAKELKDLAPRVLTFIGGCHATAIPEETLLSFPAFDLAVVGEGETTVLELLQRLSQDRPVDDVLGLALRREGRVVRTGVRPLIKELDSLPMPAFDLLPDLTRHYGVTTQSVDRFPAVSLITSRGCYAECTFCDTNVTGKTMRAHSAAYVVRMMKDVQQRYGIRCVMFEDDNFLAFRSRLHAMADIARDEKLEMTWSCTSRVDIADGDTLKKAKRMGCWQVLYGIESGSQRILDFYRKRITPQKASRALAMTKDAGLFTKGFVIVGNPLETAETLDETREFLKGSALDDISITYFTPYPGAEIYETVGRYGAFDKDWRKMTCFDIVFVPHGLSSQALESSRKRMFREFYFRTPILAGYLKRIKSWRHLMDLGASGATLAKHVFAAPSQPGYSAS